MNTLNKGKLNVGDLACISYGNQSPADDAVPLTWRVGDVRYYQQSNAIGHSKTWIKWVCIVAGTPGTWQLVRVPYALPLLQVPFVYYGVGYLGDGVQHFMAPATPDWQEGTEGLAVVNIFPVPRSPDLESTGEGPTLLELDFWIVENDWTVPTANAITVKVRLHDGTDLLVGTINADPSFTGKFSFAAVLAAGIIDGQSGLAATFEVDPAAGASPSLRLTAIMTLYRDFQADFPS